jgi:hypothetical protein
MMEIKEGQGYQNEEPPPGIQFAGWMKAGIEIGKAEYSHCTAGEKDQTAYDKENNNEIHLDTPLRRLFPEEALSFLKVP